MIPYHVELEEGAGYLHANATGMRNPENALRFLAEAYEACVKQGHDKLLLEMNLTGPSLDSGSIFRVISERSGDGTKLRKIAYVDTSFTRPEKPQFAATVAMNRGVNVRLFGDLAAAQRWIREP